MDICSIPWTHFTVKRDGKVHVCCHNPIAVGDLNHQSPEDIWHGDRYQRIRTAVQSGRYNCGCNECPVAASLLKADQPDNTPPLIETPEYPINVYIGVTDKCNARCIMCWRRFIDGPYHDMHEGILDKLDMFIAKADMVGWWGDGEIFACGYVDKVFDMMQRHNTTAHSFSTNGMQLGKWATSIAQANVTHIQISIDGATEATQQKIRPGTQLHQIHMGVDSIRNACAALGKQPPSFTLMLVAMMSNIKEISDVVRMAADWQFEAVYINKLVPHDKVLADEIIPSSEAWQYWREAQQVANQLGIAITHCHEALL